jgi:hypothetical protein
MQPRMRKQVAVGVGLFAYWAMLFLWVVRVQDENQRTPLQHIKRDVQGNSVRDANGHFVMTTDLPR